MKSIFLISGLILSCFTVFGQETKSVLFIGNSYTSANNLPSLTKQIAQSMGDDINYQTHTPGGNTLQQHAQNNTLTNKINSQSWDFVTIQAQSQEPSWPTSQFNVQTLPHANTLVNTIMANDSCTQPTFYMTWGRKDGDANNCPFAPWVCTYEGMDDSLRARYEYMAEINESLVSPVGAVWRNLRNNGISFDLYTSDKSHPSIYGSYAGALSFYTIFFEKDPELVTFVPSGISAADAVIIREAAKTVVYDSLTYWNVGAYTAQANFEFTQDTSSFIFTNSSENSMSYFWDFGNGDTSVVKNPEYMFNQPGTYQVSLIATSCNISDTLTKEIVVEGLSISDFSVDDINVFPNPTNEFLNIRSSEFNTGRIFDVNGKNIMSFDKTNQINVSVLTNGIYFIELSLEKSVKRVKFIVQD